MQLKELKLLIGTLPKYLCLIARYQAMKFLAVPRLEEKLRISQVLHKCIFWAKIANDYNNTEFGISIPQYNYFNCHPKSQLAIKGGTVDIEECDLIIDRLLFSLHKTCDAIKTDSSGFNALMEHATYFIAEAIEREIPSSDKESEFFTIEDYSTGSIIEGTPQKVFSGPLKANLDPVFNPSYSLLDSPQAFLGETLESITEYYWNLAMREIGAAEFCALSVIEYDNLPLDFYYDFCTQIWDEARHANQYLQLSISLFDEILNNSSDNRLKEIVIKFRSGHGLPVPAEKNFYEAFLNASLEERLVLLNIRTEAPAVGSITKNLKENPVIKDRPSIATVLEFDKNDEIKHGNFGYKWLKYLHPDVLERRKLMENTDSVRGLLLLTTFANYSDKTFEDVVQNIELL